MTNESRSRRALLGALASGAVAAVGGCSDGSNGGLDATDPTADSTGTDATTASEQTTSTPEPRPLEVLHAWTAGPGNDAVEALFAGFREANPEVETDVEPIGGGGTGSLDAVVRSRLANGDPPSAWAGWPGANLRQYEADHLGDADAAWTDATREAYPSALVDAARVDGEFAAVPVSVRRVNSLFYRTDVVAAAGVDPAGLDSTADLLSALATVERETDAEPFAHAARAPWSTLQLWETVLLAESDAATVLACLDGRPDPDVVTQAFERTAELLTHAPSAAQSSAFTEMADLVADGGAAFIQQGDWIAGLFGERETVYGEDWGTVPFPGVSNTFLFQANAFVPAGENPSPVSTRRFLSYCTTRDAQRRFAAERSWIPARTDVDPDAFEQFSRDRIDEFRTADAHVPSTTHGVGVPPATRNDLLDVVQEFVDSRDAERAAERTVEALSD